MNAITTLPVSKEVLAEVRERIFEAATTLRVLPDKEKAFLRSGERSCMPTPILNYWEAYNTQGARFRLPPPSASTITRMEQAFDWLTWLGSIDKQLMTIVWVISGEDRSPSGCANKLGLHRNTIRLKNNEGLAMIAKKFRGEIDVS